MLRSFDIEMEMRNAQEAGDTYKMNICRDQISQLEKQALAIHPHNTRSRPLHSHPQKYPA